MHANATNILTGLIFFILFVIVPAACAVGYREGKYAGYQRGERQERERWERWLASQAHTPKHRRHCDDGCRCERHHACGGECDGECHCGHCGN